MKTAYYKKLNSEEIKSFGKELESLREEVLSKVGEEDAAYIRRIHSLARYNEILGRLLIHFSLDPLTWMGGVGMLSLSKILDNMEIGHNVMHGQFDWMNEPSLHSKYFDWDNACDSDQWKYSHNYMHHTFTNVIGKDHDFGYGFMRLSKEREWNPSHLLQPITNFFLALSFQWGVGRHGYNVEFFELPEEERTKIAFKEKREKFLKKREKIAIKDYLLFPLLSGPFFPKVLLGNLLANMARNIWAYSVIWCGHFTDNVETFTEEDILNENRAEWYLRQIKGSSNVEGSQFFYLMSGHLSHQIEHHLFPDIPANRYEEIAPRLKEICERYGQHYNTGGFWSQFSQTWKRIFAYSLPDNYAEKIMAV